MEAAWGLWGLVGKGGAWDVPGLGPRELSPPTGNPEAYLSRGSLGQGSRGHRCGGGLYIYHKNLKKTTVLRGKSGGGNTD